MSAEMRLRFATDELERANRDAEQKRLAWLVARVAHPAVLNVDAAEEYAEAANLAAECLKKWEEATIEAQAEYFATVRRAEVGYQSKGGTTPASARRAIAESPADQAAGAVARYIARED